MPHSSLPMLPNVSRSPWIAVPLLLTCFAINLTMTTSSTFADDSEAAAGSGMSIGGERTGVIVIEARDPRRAPPLLHTGQSEATVRLNAKGIAQKIVLNVKVVQGKAETLSYGLNGSGEVTAVEGENLESWSIRRVGEDRFLDLRIKENAESLTATVHLETSLETLPASIDLAHLSQGDAIGFDSMVTIQESSDVKVSVLSVEGFVPLESADRTPRFRTSSGGLIRLKISRAGAAPAAIEWGQTSLTGTVNSDGRSARFQFRGTAHVNEDDADVTILSGDAAVSQMPSDPNFRLRLSSQGKKNVYQLVFPETGTYPVAIEFVARLNVAGDNLHTMDFTVAGGAVVPIEVTGLGENLEFQRDQHTVVPQRSDERWIGFLPATGRAHLRWKTARQTGEGKLFFTTSGHVEATVGAGLLRQDHQIDFQILQGELKSIQMRLKGPGEILDVQGNDLVSWKVTGESGDRILDATLSQPITASSRINIRSQTALSAFPIRVEGMCLQPVGAIRHSGYVRLSNSGSVRIEPTELTGLTQLSPDQYPGSPLEARQVFVYRFPAADHAFTIIADRIQPEISVSEAVQYHLAETDRTIMADIELDIREAAIRDWDLEVPSDYSVVAVTGASVADYIASTAAENQYRNLKVIFGQDVIGRQLVTLHLEKNQAAIAGPWSLPAIRYPEVKSVRGDIGVVASPGFRTVVEQSQLLVEKPLSYFPKPNANLQHAFRIREPGWSAVMQIEPLDRNVQSDAFHLYSLSQGTIYGSALINYFVTGAPVSQWRLTVPESLGNVMVDGQDIRTWQREGDTLIVSLHQPVMGAFTLLVTFEEQPDQDESNFSAGRVTPLEVQSERGFVQVVSPMQVEITTRAMNDGMLILDPLELPAEFRLLSTSPSLGTWQYTERPFQLDLRVKWFEPGTMVTQVVEFAEANSRVSKDGELVTDVVYFVKSRGRRTLQIKLPGEPVRLWAVSVNGRPVTARQSEEATLIPLPGGTDPNEPVKVNLRLGKPAVSASSAQLALPTVMAPVLKTQWKVVGDEKSVLVPKGGTVEPTTPVLRPTGFHWVAKYGLVSLALIVGLTGLGMWVSGRGGFWTGADMVSFVIAIVVAVFTSLAAVLSAGGTSILQLSVPILAAGESVVLDVDNIPVWRIDFSLLGLLIGLLGVASVIASRFFSDANWIRPAARVAGGVLIGIGVLFQGASAAVFYALLALSIFALLFIPQARDSYRRVSHKWRRWRQSRAKSNADTTPENASGITTSMIVGIALTVSSFTSHVIANEADTPRFVAADSIQQEWQIAHDDERLRATGTITLAGRPGDQFLLLKAPATLTEFASDALRLTKTSVPGIGLSYVISIPIVEEDAGSESNVDAEEEEAEDDENADDETVDATERDAEDDGESGYAMRQYKATFEYQIESVSTLKGIPVLTGGASVAELQVRYDEAGWEVSCPAAVLIEKNGDENSEGTSANVLLGPGDATVLLKPKARDVASEQTRFFIESSNLYRPGPGVVDGRHRIHVRPSQGQVNELNVSVPEGLTVSDVTGSVGSWQFDADQGRLHLQIEPTQSSAFYVNVNTQRSLGKLPAEFELEPLRVADAGGEVGLLAIAFGPDAQPEKAEPETMSAVNLGDFDSKMMFQESDVLHRVYRYGAEGGTVRLRVVPVEPEVRVASQQALSLGDERVVLNINCIADITRAGLFQLSFPLPAGLEVESISGSALHHWSESNENDGRVIVLHLNGKTIGTQNFAIVLSGASPSAEREWEIPRFAFTEANRQTGELVVRPTTGIRLRTVTRQNVSETDPRAIKDQVRGSVSGGLAFRLLQRDWKLTLGIDQLAPWVTGQVLHEITMREGQTRSTLIANFKVENASIRQMQVVLPIDDESEIKTLRANGKIVSDLVRTQPNSNIWEVQFKRRVLGKIDFRIEYERRGDRDNDTESLVPVQFPQARQLSYYYGIRAGGRLEIDHEELTQGWQRVDWNTIPSTLRNAENHSVPSLTLRAVSPESPLPIRANRHSLANALKLRVADGTLATILSPTGDQLTAVDLTVEVIQRSSLSVGLPQGSELFNVFVNGESVHSIRQGGNVNAWQFYILPGIDDRTAKVRFVYSVPGDRIKRIHLQSPVLNVPLENIRWNVLAPEGFRMVDSDGNLELIEQANRDVYDRASYLSKMKGKRQNQAQEAASLLEQANELLQAGEQTKAKWAFNSVANQYGLDAASNEDARVQLENLQTQQAIVGLNTRRQRLYMDNYKNDAVPLGDEQLRQAAADNPILQQEELNFRPQQLSELLRGNTTEDNAVLQAIAYRLVQHQRATETAPQAIQISLPEEGTMYSFSRTVQVTENAPLDLDLKFESRYRIPFWQSGLLVLLLALTAAVLTYASTVPWRKEFVPPSADAA
ncbi:hypothetical protein FHS27_005138 [Rhodopirellula rubra]|uniref:Uncharacterized protein n=1 Tax=Aporhodopirellula rubra TaxID=980271 RepID=A0A7W5E391_9BACT|nr:hypothetical protein [Aporhodopirellula rubra]MBB3209298.1 hypothetical protein [Aporhodopirellula rubra]